MQLCGVLFSYGSVSVICNRLASYSIRSWRRSFLLPYLTFLPMVLTMSLIYLVRLIFMSGISEALLPPLIASTVIVYIWLKIFKQWFSMSKTIAMINQHEVESRAMALAAAFAILHMSPVELQDAMTSQDLPPSYETLEVDMTSPPGYDEAVQFQCSEELTNQF